MFGTKSQINPFLFDTFPNYLHLIPLLTLSHRGCQYLAGEQHFNISCFKQTRRWSPFYLLHCVFLCLCACFVEHCSQAVGGGLQAQYSSRESGVEAFFVHLRLYVYILSVVCCVVVRSCRQAVGGGLQAQYSRGWSFFCLLCFLVPVCLFR